MRTIKCANLSWTRKKLGAEIAPLQSGERWNNVTTLTILRWLRLETYQNLDQSKQIIQKFGCEFKFECFKFLTRFLWNIETFNYFGSTFGFNVWTFFELQMNVKITFWDSDKKIYSINYTSFWFMVGDGSRSVNVDVDLSCGWFNNKNLKKEKKKTFVILTKTILFYSIRTVFMLLVLRAKKDLIDSTTALVKTKIFWITLKRSDTRFDLELTVSSVSQWYR